MHVEFLVEELSMNEVLQNLLPKILGETITFDIHPYQGKFDLTSKLPLLSIQIPPPYFKYLQLEDM